jgi:hypothetical protein
MTEDILNEALFNLTMSAAIYLGNWPETVQVEVNNTHNIYSFEGKLQFFLPYGLCLILALPLLYLGLQSLHHNGVSAMDGGFLQLLMTTSGSRTLDKAIAGGCIGGEENVSESLKELKVRFGEFTASDADAAGTRVARAGFGTEDEVGPLRRRVLYGT